MKKIILILLYLSISGILSQSGTDYNEWKKDRGIYEVDGVNFEIFFNTHPMTLFVMYDDSDLSNETIEMLQELKEEFEKANIKIQIAKMHKSNDISLSHRWKIYHHPYVRFIIGNGVSVTLRDFPDIDNLFSWIAKIYKNKTKITEVNTAELKDQFHKEVNAFYLRYDPKKQDYYNLLTSLQMIAKNRRIYYSINPTYDVFENYNEEDTVLGFRRDFEDKVKFLSTPDQLNSDSIQQFFYSYMEPKTVSLTEDLLNKIMTKRTRTAFYFGSKSYNSVQEAFISVASEQNQNILFVIVDHNDEYADEMRQYLKVDKNAHDEIRIMEHDGSDFKVYRVDGKTKADITSQFDNFNSRLLDEIHEREAYNDGSIDDL